MSNWSNCLTQWRDENHFSPRNKEISSTSTAWPPVELEVKKNELKAYLQIGCHHLRRCEHHCEIVKMVQISPILAMRSRQRWTRWFLLKTSFKSKVIFSIEILHLFWRCLSKTKQLTPPKFWSWSWGISTNLWIPNYFFQSQRGSQHQNLHRHANSSSQRELFWGVLCLAPEAGVDPKAKMLLDPLLLAPREPVWHFQRIFQLTNIHWDHPTAKNNTKNPGSGDVLYRTSKWRTCGTSEEVQGAAGLLFRSWRVSDIC